MTDDIVQRLRAHGQPKDWHTPGHPMNGWVSAYEAQAIGKAAADVIERLRAVIAQAVTELDDEHRDGDEAARGRHGGCVICWPRDGSWPCTTRMVADDLRNALTPKDPT